MKIYNSLEGFKSNNAVLTIGTFDGVHIGHQKILSRLREIADEIYGEVTLLTFHPHPRLVLYPSQNDMQLLTTQNEKADLLEKYGVDNLVFMPFTHEFSRLSYEEFVKQVIVDGIHAHVVVIGYDHHFGHNREGGLKQLQLLSKVHSFRVEEIPEQDIDYAAVSSTRVRKALLAGDVASANQLLAHAYSISGKVIHGNHIGRELGFPTANMLVEEHKLIPSNGIYAVKVFVDEEIFNGMLSIGNRPTFDNGARSVEVNILDFNRDIYDKEITIELLHYLREEVRFNGKEELIEQMKKDKLLTMELLS